ncbi:MAG: hypothetical protein ACKN9U_16140, partial [Pirellulaceae bacterium]
MSPELTVEFVERSKHIRKTSWPLGESFQGMMVLAPNCAQARLSANWPSDLNATAWPRYALASKLDSEAIEVA